MKALLCWYQKFDDCYLGSAQRETIFNCIPSIMMKKIVMLPDQ